MAKRATASTALKSPKKTKPAATATRKAGSKEVTLDRRRAGRRDDEKTKQPVAVAPAPAAPLERREKVNRRRQIDPTTCERDYSLEEVEFMSALDIYKRKNGRMFPTCSEVLEVIRDLGYVKQTMTGNSLPTPPALVAAEQLLAQGLED